MLLFEVGLYSGDLIDAMLALDHPGIVTSLCQCLAFAVAGTVLMITSAYMVRGGVRLRRRFPGPRDRPDSLCPMFFKMCSSARRPP